VESFPAWALWESADANDRNVKAQDPDTEYGGWDPQGCGPLRRTAREASSRGRLLNRNEASALKKEPFMSKLRQAGVLILFALCCFAQLNRGTITGTVNDTSGAVIPQVQVVVQNAATNVKYQTQSEAGDYTVPGLPPGPYQITFEAAGFKKMVRSELNLEVNQVLRVDVALEVGALTESVEVTVPISVLQTDSAEVGTTLPESEFKDLPMTVSDVRSPENFAYLLSPGASGSSWTSHINGSAEYSKETILDGATVTTERAGDYSQSAVSPEAIEEFREESSGQSVILGRSAEGVFNYAMKSGTNQIHGSSYIGVRREWMEANTFTNNFYGDPRPIDRKLDYAFAFGGPVYIPKLYNGKNRTFFYSTYERFKQRTDAPIPASKTAPLADFYKGDFSRLLGTTVGTDALGNTVLKGAVFDPQTFYQLSSGTWEGFMFPNNQIPVSRFSRVSQAVNALAVPGYLPNVVGPGGVVPLVNNAEGYPSGGVSQYDQYAFTVKGDQIVTDKIRVSGSYNLIYRPRTYYDQGGLNDLLDTSVPLSFGPLSSADIQDLRTTLARLGLDYTITPRLLNNVSVFYNRHGSKIFNLNENVDGAKALGIQNLDTNGYPQIIWGNGPAVTLANVGDTQRSYAVPMGYGLADTVSFSKGRHFMKAGIDLRRNPTNNRPTQAGQFTFSALSTSIPNEPYSGNTTGYSFASYLLGIVDSASLVAPVGFTSQHRDYSMFWGDDFKVTSKFTLNLGVRWEYQPPVQERLNRMAAWSPTAIDPLSGLPGAYTFAGNCSGCTGQDYFGVHDYKGFLPRLGFAWHPSEKWTLRSAFGIFMVPDILGMNGVSQFAWQGTYNLGEPAVNPWKGLFNWDNGFPLNSYVAPSINPSYGDTVSGGATMEDPRYGIIPYTMNWNFNIQRELPKGTMLELGYVANKGNRLYTGGYYTTAARYNQIPVSALAEYGSELNNPVTTPQQAVQYGIKYPYPGFSGTLASALRPYPQLYGNNTISDALAPLGFSTYESAEILLNRHFGKNLTVFSNFVFSKNLTNMDYSPVDYYNLRNLKSPSSWNNPKVFKAYIEYRLPVGRGQSLLNTVPRVVDQIIGGWAISAILNYSDGAPLSFSGASSPFPTGWNGGTNMVNIAPGNMFNSSFSKSAFNYANLYSAQDKYLNTSLFSNPPAYTLGNAAQSYLQIQGFGTQTENMSLLKTFRVHEKYRFQLRIEALDVFNRSQLGGINTNITSPLFGQVTSVSGNRVCQAVARVDF
jgi:hypothetical protein